VQTLRPYFVEEAMELDHAMGTGDGERLRDELGDVLLHVAFQIVLAEERREFGAEELVQAVEQKMWRRHPHLFQEDGTHIDRDVDMGEVRRRWEVTKRAENGIVRPSILDGLPPGLPALLEAYRLQEKAAGVGFDWPNADGPRRKVQEELQELDGEVEAGADRPRIADEVGDVLFAVVNLSRKLGIDPRAALEEANRKFDRRFRQIEAAAGKRGIDMHTAGLETLDELWEEAKGVSDGE
jgi:MazG family protein